MGTKRRIDHSRSKSRSRSVTRSYHKSKSKRSKNRGDNAEKRGRSKSYDSISEWRTKEKRRTGMGAAEKGTTSKRAKEEQMYLEVKGDHDVCSTYDAIFLVAKYLLELQENGSLPLDIYAIRRGLSQHFHGAQRLRFNAVCNIPALSAILKYLWKGGAVSKGEGRGDDDKHAKLSKKIKHDSKSNIDGRKLELHEQRDSKREVTDNEGDDTAQVDNNKRDAEANTDSANEISKENVEPTSALDIYFERIQTDADHSYKDLNVEATVIDLELKDGLLHVTGIRPLRLKKILLRNRKKNRVIDFEKYTGAYDIMEDIPANDQVEETATAEPDATDEKATQNNTVVDTDIATLYKALYQNTAREMTRISEFQLKELSGFREICAFGTRAECRMNNRMAMLCDKVHFKRIILPNTLVQLGDCSYLDTCRHIETCRFVHYQVENDLPPRPIVDEVSEGQWICCDVRKLNLAIFNPFVSVVMADPPWDIHMDLPYGTMKDSEMKNLKVQNIQDEGLLFLWVTGRTLEVGRECMEIWGYRQIDEIVWVKTNQLQRIIRTGRTGHWLNHSKEHCLIGIKGNPVINRYIDCDVVVSEVRETSRKPDEIYRLIERMVPGALKLEIFGRSHNVRNNWITLGNQLDGYNLTHPEIKRRYEETIAQDEENNAATVTQSPKPEVTDETPVE